MELANSAIQRILEWFGYVEKMEEKCLMEIIGSFFRLHIPLFKLLQFHANGLVILERNYLEVYPYENWSGKVIAHYEQGQTFQPTTLEMVSGETSAPPYLTEADLIALMEKHGIGE